MGKLIIYQPRSRSENSTVDPIINFSETFITFSQGVLAALGIKPGTRVLFAEDPERPGEVLISKNEVGQAVTVKTGGRVMSVARTKSLNRKILGRYILKGESQEHKGWSVLSPYKDDE